MPDKCFFFVNYKTPKPTIEALCYQCGLKANNTMYWDGGFGPWKVQCFKCNKIIHEYSDDAADTRQSPTDN
jgi:hypothetical protein